MLIGFSLADATVLPRVLAASPEDAMKIPSSSQLDAWLRIEKDGAIRVFTGKVEIGMGVETGFAQIVAEELDVSPEQVRFVMGDTATTTDQGGVGGSTSIMLGAKPLRNVAATARFLLLQLAGQHLGAPLEQLEVRDGIVTVHGDASKSVSYGDLAGAADLNDSLKVTGRGFALNVEGPANRKILRATGWSESHSRGWTSLQRFWGSGSTSPMCESTECCTAAWYVRLAPARSS